MSNTISFEPLQSLFIQTDLHSIVYVYTMICTSRASLCDSVTFKIVLNNFLCVQAILLSQCTETNRHV